MKAPLLAALLAVSLGACAQTGTQTGFRAVDPNTPIAPGASRISERPIDPDKWLIRSGALRRPNRPPQQVTFHVCRQLSCPSPAFAVVSYTPTQTRSPDRAALERIATEQMPGRNELNELVASARGDGARHRIILSQVATFKGQPGIAVEIERRRDAHSPVIYQVGGFAFAGNLMISVQSFSTDRALARRNRDQILDRIDIREGPRPDGQGATQVIQTTAPQAAAAPPAPRL
ncbi:MAG: hypothetical protein J0H01_20220 [Rhizobiales bacterium]|nr:hypothetical protein [Hyphomicrobiales bacterium]